MQKTMQHKLRTEHLRWFSIFQDFPEPFVVFSMTFQDLWHVEVLVYFSTVNATFAAHCYRTLYKLLCHSASNIPVVTYANVLQLSSSDGFHGLSRTIFGVFAMTFQGPCTACRNTSFLTRSTFAAYCYATLYIFIMSFCI